MRLYVLGIGACVQKSTYTCGFVLEVVVLSVSKVSTYIHSENTDIHTYARRYMHHHISAARIDAGVVCERRPRRGRLAGRRLSRPLPRLVSVFFTCTEV
jgi:hypothetical protein